MVSINIHFKVPVLDSGGAFKDYGDLYKVQLLCTDLANQGSSNALNDWLSSVYDLHVLRFFQRRFIQQGLP